MLYVTPWWNIAKRNYMLRHKTVDLKCAGVASLYKVFFMSQFSTVDRHLYWQPLSLISARPPGVGGGERGPQ